MFNCHTHTEFSNCTTGLDSINKLDNLVAYAKEIGLTGLAITDHDNLSGVMRINKKQKEEKDFTIAIGNEIYLIDDFNGDKQKYYHFLLVAKDKIGYQALVELSSRAWYRSEVKHGKRRVPTLKTDIEEVLQWSRGHLVASSACLGGELPTLVNEGKLDEAKAFIKWCQDQFGEEDFYIEIQPSYSKDQINFNEIAQTFGVQPIVTTDAHYLKKKDFPLFEAFLRSKQADREVQEYYEYARLMPEQEAREILKGLGENFINAAFQNTEKVRGQIEFYDLAQTAKIPKVPVKEMPPMPMIDLTPYPTLLWAAAQEDPQTQYCIRTCLNSIIEKGFNNPKYLNRLEEEFDVFKFQSEELQDNFFAYFNNMQHYLDLAWSIDCAVGPSRGSASGSLLCYFMNIVQCDPLQYNLPFWRFANKVRTSPLDIDVDFMPSKRAELFKTIRQERGELGLTQIATFRKLTLKAAIGNACRGYLDSNKQKIDPDVAIYLSSLVEVRRGFVATLEETLHGNEVTGFKINNTFIKECNTYPGLLDIIKQIEGVIVGSSTHAAGVVMFDDKDKLTGHCSLMRAPNGDLCSALDLHDIEDAGCYKFDYLLLSSLDIISTCFKLLQKHNMIDGELSLKECYRKYINPNTIDFNDSRIWDRLQDGSVLSVFQFDAPSGISGIAKTKPRTLDEMTALNGLIRLQSQPDVEDQLTRFCRIKDNPIAFEEEMIEVGLNAEQRQILHEELDKYNGCAVTQESFMILVQRLAGYSLKQADALRKTVAKKKMSEITSQKKLFFSQLGDQASKIKQYFWNTIIAPSLGYGSDKLGPYTLNAFTKRVA